MDKYLSQVGAILRFLRQGFTYGFKLLIILSYSSSINRLLDPGTLNHNRQNPSRKVDFGPSKLQEELSGLY